MLLHVLEAPVPIDATVNWPGIERLFNHVQHRAVFAIDNVHDGHVAERASIERLPARRRIENGPVENGRAAIAKRDDLLNDRIELASV
jgi:hypothetical protein